MKVYIVIAKTAEPFETFSWPYLVFDSEEKAVQCIRDNPGVLEEDVKNNVYGFFLSTHIATRELL